MQCITTPAIKLQHSISWHVTSQRDRPLHSHPALPRCRITSEAAKTWSKGYKHHIGRIELFKACSSCTSYAFDTWHAFDGQMFCTWYGTGCTMRRGLCPSHLCRCASCDGRNICHSAASYYPSDAGSFMQPSTPYKGPYTLAQAQRVHKWEPEPSQKVPQDSVLPSQTIK